MTFSEFELKRYGKVLSAFVESRRARVDLAYRLGDQSLEIFEVGLSADEELEADVAKATYVKERDIWRVFWGRADKNWHQYDPAPEVKRFEDFLAVVDRDECGYFFGPQPQPHGEIRQLLGEHLENGTPCGIMYEDVDNVCDEQCFVVSLHSDFVVLSRISQTSWVNGWIALRFRSITRVDRLGDTDTDFILRAMVANGVSLPLAPPVNFGTFHEFLCGICDTFRIITMDDDPTLVHPSAAGTIIAVNSKSITIRAMSTEGFWETESHTIELKHITHVLFGSRYEQTLERIAELPDT